MDKKKLLSSLVSRLGLLPILRRYDARTPSLKILAYHRVMDVDVGSYLFDEHLVDATVSDFDRQMAFLSKNYDVLPLSEAAEEFRKPGKPDIVSLTFDDGFDDLYFNVFPILKKYNIRPTVFITTGLIGTDDTLWSEKLVYAVKSNIGKKLSLPVPGYSSQDVIIQKSNVDSIIECFLRHLKRVPDEGRSQRLNELLEDLDIKQTQDFVDSKMMTWDMVKEMSDWGVEFGSHSVSHPILSQLTDERLVTELRDSKATIERQLSLPCTTLAYPVGGAGAYNDTVKTLAKEIGYEFACSYLSGIVRNVDDVRYELQRLHVDSTVSPSWFQGLLTCPKFLAANFMDS